VTTASTSNVPVKDFKHEIVVDAAPEVVWRAISEGEELRRWFPIDARVKPGVGGSIFLSWGPACEGEAPITIWETGKHLRWEESHENGAVVIAVDFFVEAAERGQTRLRLVQSGFGRGAKWDDMYDSISNGWKFELLSLDHYLSRHRGIDRTGKWLTVASPLPPEQAYDRLVARGALAQDAALTDFPADGEYRFTGPDRRIYSGRVLRTIPHRSFVATVRELDDAILRIEIERAPASQSMPGVWLAIWGPKRDLAAPIAEQWRTAIERSIQARPQQTS